ncbi:MAG: MFS transporter [Reyranellaceae bacterium]
MSFAGSARRGGARTIDAAVMFAVALASLLLLLYVGYGEARRTYPLFLAEKMTAQGALIQTPMETYLRAGLPLRQFPGFRQIADPILGSDPSLASIAARDRTGLVFSAGAATPDLPPVTQDLHTSEDWLQIAVPLRNRFETVGGIVVTMPRAAAMAPIDAAVPWLAALAAVLAIVFALLSRILPSTGARISWLAIAYAACFAAMAGAVVYTLVSLYADGAQARVKALADSLAQRLKPIVAYDLALGDFEGIDRAFDDYLRLNADLRAVALLLDESVAIHTDRAARGKPWRHEGGTFEYRAAIGRTGEGREIRVAVALPSDVVWSAVARSIKNFAALFLAAGLMAALFLQLGRSVGRGRRGEDHSAALAVVRPVFFVGVFAESLATGFLPQLVRQAATEAGAGAGAASLAFTAYFLCFLLVLLPASHAAERRGGRMLIVVGATLAALAWLLPALAQTYPSFVLSRGLAGFGQGLLFIGVQHLVLAHAPAGQRTQAAAIIVYGFNGGMISGAALGSLLVNYIAPAGVFFLAATSATMVAVYGLTLLPSSREAPTQAAQSLGASLLGMLRSIPRALGSAGFLRAIFLIGAPSKATLTGIVAFGLPLILSQLGFPAEDIGQIIMLYGCGVLLASGPVSRLVDRTGSSRAVLIAGGIGAGLATMMIGTVGLSALPAFLQSKTAATLIVAAGTLALGLAHGCINAPIVTHVSGTSAGERLGPAGASALYRVLERIGHVAGPVLAAQLLLLAGTGPASLLWAGGGLLALAIAFALFSRSNLA